MTTAAFLFVRPGEVPVVRRTVTGQCDEARELRNIAVDFVKDEVGKHHYVDTLDSAAPATSYPIGTVVLSYALGDKTVIHCHRVKERVSRGWVYNSTKKCVEHIGYFMCVPLASHRAAITHMPPLNLLAADEVADEAAESPAGSCTFELHMTPRMSPRNEQLDGPEIPEPVSPRPQQYFALPAPKPVEYEIDDTVDQVAPQPWNCPLPEAVRAPVPPRRFGK